MSGSRDKDLEKAPILEEGPGDYSSEPRIPKYRGDHGESESEKHVTDEDEKTIHYGREDGQDYK